ncbi:hypothetical protein A2Z00_03215 [Candidatus Gottesmanbacteria bacterium RBG_13_45_10]|uniref:Uncharacterized protein n=1 Tax=Candidatus Gottesmanbacteria bacterium RBG_13_45_10 TaxID=1798370 RepID=A0A1F5ZHM3_9BACT|nr:MAG: hypothetical protein A2Z00_03215 [Candidatus Gottesmanbacteria bacterium RBG_13_45_10]
MDPAPAQPQSTPSPPPAPTPETQPAATSPATPPQPDTQPKSTELDPPQEAPPAGSPDPPSPTSPQKSRLTWLLIVVLVIVAFLLGIGVQKFYPVSNIHLPKLPFAKSTPKPTPTSTPTPTPNPMANWKTYSNQKLGIELKYPDSENPIEKFTPVKSGQSIFIVTGTLNFNSNKIALCKTNKETLCLIPGKNWSQEKDILPTTLSGKKAISFFISTKNADSGSNVMHVIQTTEKPAIEIAFTVDGQGGEETFQQILSTVKFSDQASNNANWKTYTSSDLSFKYPPEWTLEGMVISSSSPKIRIVAVPKTETLMNECMQLTGTENTLGLTVKKFVRVTKGEACATGDTTPRENWVIPSATAYAPGISFEYSETQATAAGELFTQILSTFKFLNKATPSATPSTH